MERFGLNSTDQQSSDIKLYTDVFAGILTTQGIVAISGNLLTLYCIVRTRSLWTNQNVLIAGLAAADFSAGFLFISMFIESSARGAVSCESRLRAFGEVVWRNYPFTVSLAHLVLISVDRYIYIVRPLLYHAIVTRRALVLMMSGAWLIPLPVFLICLYFSLQDNCQSDFQELQFELCLLCICIGTVVILMCVLYARIYLEARRQAERLRRLDMHQGPAPNKQKPVSMKAVKVTMTILGTFLVCSIPTFVVVVMAIGNGQANKAISTTTLVTAFSGRASLALNHGANVFIYAGMNRELRRVYVEVVCCYWAKKTNNRVMDVSAHE